MANIITAGNSTNGGTSVATDTSGTLDIKTGTGSGTTAISIDASQNVTMAANLSVTGNTTITGTITATGGVSGGIRSGTAVASTSGTSIDFTSLPTGIKRITVMLNGVGTSGTSNLQIQIGSGSFTTSGYTSALGLITFANSAGYATISTGFIAGTYNVNTEVISGVLTLVNITGNVWAISGTTYRTGTTAVVFYNSSIPLTLGGVLDRIRITANGTDTFDAGSINILFE